MPLLPIIGFVILLVRLASSRNAASGGGERAGRRHEALIPDFGAGDLSRTVAWTVALVAIGEGWWETAVAATVLVLLSTFPGTTARVALRVLPLQTAVRLLPMVAPHHARGNEPAWVVLAALDSPSVPRTSETFAALDKLLARPTQPVPITLYARAALADAKGDDIEARDLMEVLHELDVAPAPWPARVDARVWLLVRAATRGFHAREEELRAGGDAAVRAVARALAGLREERRPGRWAAGVLAIWHRQPRLARALQTVPFPKRVERPSGPPAGTAPLTAALWWQRRVCLVVPTEAELRACGAAWDALPNLPEVMDHVSARCEAVGFRPAVDPDGDGAPAAIRILSQAWQEAVRQLAAVAVLSRALPPDVGATLGAARRVAREQLFKELADHAASLTGEARADIANDPFLGWLRFHRLRTIVDTLQAGAPVGERALAFEEARGPVLSAAAWLYNQRGQRFLAHHMMRWLEGAGMGVMSPELEETMRKNVALGY